MFSFTPSLSYAVTTNLSPVGVNEVFDALINTSPDRWNDNWNYMGNTNEFRIDKTIYSGRGTKSQIIALGSMKNEGSETIIQIDYEYVSSFANVFLWSYTVIAGFTTLVTTLAAIINMFTGHFTFYFLLPPLFLCIPFMYRQGMFTQIYSLHRKLLSAISNGPMPQ